MTKPLLNSDQKLIIQHNKHSNFTRLINITLTKHYNKSQPEDFKKVSISKYIDQYKKEW